MVIYNTKWYTYEKEYQTDLSFALNVIQNGSAPICVAYIYPLNFETGLQVRANFWSQIVGIINFAFF